MLYTDHRPDSNMATVRLDQKSRALVRGVPDSYSRALAKFFGNGPTDINLAKKHHLGYVIVFLVCQNDVL